MSLDDRLQGAVAFAPHFRPLGTSCPLGGVLRLGVLPSGLTQEHQDRLRDAIATHVADGFAVHVGTGAKDLVVMQGLSRPAEAVVDAFTSSFAW